MKKKSKINFREEAMESGIEIVREGKTAVA